MFYDICSKLLQLQSKAFTYLPDVGYDEGPRALGRVGIGIMQT